MQRRRTSSHLERIVCMIEQIAMTLVQSVKGCADARSKWCSAWNGGAEQTEEVRILRDSMGAGISGVLLGADHGYQAVPGGALRP